MKVNEAWKKVLGYSKKELEGKAILDFVHPDDRKDIQRAIDEQREQKNVFGRIHRYLAKDGSQRYIEWSSKVDNDLIYIAARDITEKKIVEEQLLKREKSFRSFVDTYQDIIIVGKRTGEIEYANPAALRKLGYSIEQFRQMYLRDLREDEKTTCPTALKKIDGTFLPVETMEWVGVWNGKDCIVVVSKDLSIQQAVLERFQQLFDNNPALMAISNAEDNRLLDVNAAFLEKLGFTKAEVIGRTSIELNIFDDPHKKPHDTQILPRNQKIKNLELRVRRKDGQMIDGLFSGDLIRNQTENIFLTVMMDITEQKEAQRQLAKQAGLILSLLDSIPELVFYKDIGGVYLGCNPTCAEFFGKAKEDIVGKTDYELFDKKTADSIYQFDQEIFKKRASQHNEEWLTYADGRRRLFDTMKTPYRDASGNIIGIIGISRDITENKKKEEEIKELSVRDELSGLYNRRYYEEQLAAFDNEENLPLTIIMGDVDGLKFINDSFGHALGDELLKKTAEAICKACRSDDIIARIGGDEFVVLLPHTDPLKAGQVIRRIEGLMEKEKVGVTHISASFGSATKTNASQNIQEIYKTAEDHMYRNKLKNKAEQRRKRIDEILSSQFAANPGDRKRCSAVAEISKAIASAMGLSADDAEKIHLAGMMHDIGKIAVNQEVWQKTGSLNFTEWGKIRKHAEIGCRILSSDTEYAQIAPYVMEHHERWDGTGYPNGLKGAEISVFARILAVADAYTAMTSERSYAKTMSVKEAADEMRRCAGTQFDPAIVEIFTGKVLGV